MVCRQRVIRRSCRFNRSLIRQRYRIGNRVNQSDYILHVRMVRVDVFYVRTCINRRNLPAVLCCTGTVAAKDIYVPLTILIQRNIFCRNRNFRPFAYFQGNGIRRVRPRTAYVARQMEIIFRTRTIVHPEIEIFITTGQCVGKLIRLQRTDCIHIIIVDIPLLAGNIINLAVFVGFAAVRLRAERKRRVLRRCVRVSVKIADFKGNASRTRSKTKRKIRTNVTVVRYVNFYQSPSICIAPEPAG